MIATPNKLEQKGQALTTLAFRKLMPLLLLVYVISFLDRTNIALAKAHLSVDLGISAAAYGLGAGLFFLSYALMEVPSNLIMHRVGARFWITRIMITWGLLSAGMAFVTDEYTFYVMRILLGAAEAGLFPGVLLYLTYWFGRKDRARATAYFLLGVCIANVISGPLGGLLLKLDGVMGWHGWQWLFVIEGLPAVFLSYYVWKKLPDGPSSAKWLTPEQANEFNRILDQERAEEAAAGHSGHSLRAVVADKQIWLAIFIYFFHQIAVYSVVFYLPQIISGYGQLSTLQVGFLNSLPWIAAAIGAVLIPRYAVTPKLSRLIIFAGICLMAVGLLIGAYATPVIALAGFTLTAGMFYVVQPVLLLFPSSRLSGAGLAGGLALINTFGITGGFFGPMLMGQVEQATGQLNNTLVIIAVTLLLSAGLAFRLRQGQERRALTSLTDEVEIKRAA